MPTTDDLIADSNGATHFSTLHLSSGYHQLELAPESRNVTTFSTHTGLRRYKRLPFGINAASEIFQEGIRELLTGLQGCKNISGDIIVLGKSQQEHDMNLRGVLQRLQENNLRLNEDKCEIKFYGRIFSSSGIRPDPSKVEAIQTASPPKKPSEVFAWHDSVCITFYFELCHDHGPTSPADETSHTLEMGTKRAESIRRVERSFSWRPSDVPF